MKNTVTDLKREDSKTENTDIIILSDTTQNLKIEHSLQEIVQNKIKEDSIVKKINT